MKNLYNLIMNCELNPLSNIPDTNTRHMIMQILAWMWCIIFSMSIGSVIVFGISLFIHAVILLQLVHLKQQSVIHNTLVG